MNDKDYSQVLAKLLFDWLKAKLIGECKGEHKDFYKQYGFSRLIRDGLREIPVDFDWVATLGRGDKKSQGYFRANAKSDWFEFDTHHEGYQFMVSILEHINELSSVSETSFKLKIPSFADYTNRKILNNLRGVAKNYPTLTTCPCYTKHRGGTIVQWDETKDMPNEVFKLKRLGEMPMGGLSKEQLNDYIEMESIIDKFLRETFWTIDEKRTFEVIDWWLRVHRYMLMGQCDEDLVIFNVGSGENGKGVLMNAMASLFGECAQPVDAQDITGNETKNQFFKGDLVGKRYFYVDELLDNVKLNVALIKQLSGGIPLKANIKYKAPFTYHCEGTLVVNTNHVPEFNNKLGLRAASVARRVVIIPFANRPKKKDVTLRDKLSTPMARRVFFDRIQAVKTSYEKRGIEEPEFIKNHYLNVAKVNQNVLLDCLDKIQTKIKFCELYDEYLTRCEEEKEYVRSKRAISSMIDLAKGFEVVKGSQNVSWVKRV